MRNAVVDLRACYTRGKGGDGRGGVVRAGRPGAHIGHAPGDSVPVDADCADRNRGGLDDVDVLGDPACCPSVELDRCRCAGAVRQRGAVDFGVCRCRVDAATTATGDVDVRQTSPRACTDHDGICRAAVAVNSADGRSSVDVENLRCAGERRHSADLGPTRYRSVNVDQGLGRACRDRVEVGSTNNRACDQRPNINDRTDACRVRPNPDVLNQHISAATQVQKPVCVAVAKTVPDRDPQRVARC